MESLVKLIVSELVDNKDCVVVSSEENSENYVTIKVDVDANDMGKVIGKHGKIAQAIRTIIKTASSKSGKRYLIQIGDKVGE